MASFKTTCGKEFQVPFTVRHYKRVKEATGLDLASEFEKSFSAMAADPVILANVVYQIVKDQFQGDEEAFAELLDGETLEAAQQAVLNAVIDFFPNQKKEAARNLVTKANVLAGHLAARAMVVMDERMARMEKSIATTSFESLSSLPDELDKLLGNTRSAS